MVKEIQETNDYDKNEEYNELRESIIERIDQIDKFFELNFDNPYAFHFEKGRIRLKKLLMFEPNLINQLDNGKDFKGLAFGLKGSNENINTENMNYNNNSFLDRSRPLTPIRAPPMKKKGTRANRSVEKTNISNNSMMYMKPSGIQRNNNLNKSSINKSKTNSVKSNLRSSYQPKSNYVNNDNNLRGSVGKQYKKSNTNFVNRNYIMNERDESQYNNLNNNYEDEDDGNNLDFDDGSDYPNNSNNYIKNNYNNYNYNYNNNNYNKSPNNNLRGSNFSKKSNNSNNSNYNYNNNAFTFQQNKKKGPNKNNIKVSNFINNEDDEVVFKGSNMSFKPNYDLERFNNKKEIYNENEEEEENDDGEIQNFQKEELKEITIRFKLTEEEYRLLLREKAKIVVQIPNAPKTKMSNNNRMSNRSNYY